MTIKILTDSASDIPDHLRESYDIDVVPLAVIMNDKEYFEKETINPDTLYKAMRNGKAPTTSQVPPERMKHMFETYAQQGQSCIYIGFSAALSGTFQTAVNMKQEVLDDYPSFDLETIDSQSASIGQGLIVLHAAKLAQEGQGKDDILAAIHDYISRIEHIFTVDDLTYLVRGGRMSKTSAYFGNLLHIKPILGITKGEIVPLDKVRGSKKLTDTS